jgi:two-component system, OmpR family, phosphate regulon response regulator OmpR
MVDRILIIDDDERLAAMLGSYLVSRGFAVEQRADGRSGLAALEAGDMSAVILDVMLPDMDGFEICRRIRAKSDVPVLMLTARGDDLDRIVGLELGADDYVAKPFSVRELLARVRVALRRGDTAGARAESNWLERGPIRLDLAEHSATVRGEAVALTRTQFALLACFLRHPGRLLTHRAIVTEVWGDPDAAAADNLRVQVSQLRRRIEEDARHPALIVTEPGLGYRFLPG